MPRRRPRARAPDLAGVAVVVQRLGVLLTAGVTPTAAWGYLRDGNVPGADAGAGIGAVVHAVADAVADGAAIPDALLAALTGLERREAAAWRGVAAAWWVASASGAPLAPTLRDFAAALRSLAQAQRDIRVALAAPAATARMVLALPAVGMLFGLLLGFNTFATLATTPIGWFCLAVGSALLFAAARWNRSLVASAQPRNLTPGLSFDLMAIAMAGGGAPPRAKSTVERALQRCGLPAVGLDAIDAVVDLSVRAGVPAAELLRSEADESRRSARAEVQERAAALSVKLMLPLGLCILPAFMVLGVLPLIATVLASTVVPL